jgi:hypothetical protein
MAYLFTFQKGRLVEFSHLPAGSGNAALRRRRQLQKKSPRKIIVAWARMGGDNPGV